MFFSVQALTPLLLFCTSALSAMHQGSFLPALPTPPALKKSSTPLLRPKTVPQKSYNFGEIAAKSLEEIVALGCIKNEHPYRLNHPLIALNVGHCVIVPRSDHSFSYGVVTEVLNPQSVCVVCDKKSRHEKGYTIKIIASNQLFLQPEWLNHTQKDTVTLTHYTKVMQQADPLPPLKDEESYERLPKQGHARLTKVLRNKGLPKKRTA